MEAEFQTSQYSDTELVERVDQSLERIVSSLGLPDALRKAISYSLFGGGKRVRPLLCLRACQAVDGELDDAISSACAIELIHTFSLVHDDLPAMDDDDLRRGRPTLHKHTNEAMAILAGDAMTSIAFGVLGLTTQDRESVGLRLVNELSLATSDMISGQIYDTMGGQPEKFSPIDRLKMTHGYKTGALLSASIRMGAISGGASEDQIDQLTGYAGPIGQMFQAVDDLLDVTQSAEKMGKATGKDAEAGKLTYPGLLGVEGTRAEIEKLRAQAIEALSGFDAKADPLREMAHRLAERQK